MSSTTVVAAAVFAIVAIGVMMGAWWYATKMRSKYDASPAAFQPTLGLLQMSPSSIASLREFSPEPILLKQSADGVRVQVGYRPMLPVVAFASQHAYRALVEIAGAVSQQHGAQWVVVVQAVEGERVTVQRIA
ncbi:MAG: hypothetical protein R2826_06810 [Thermoleophilia bacterium]